MATPRTRRLVAVGEDSAKLNAAVRARRRLLKEATKLIAEIARLNRRLEEVNEEEEVISDAIEQHAEVIAEAHAGPPEEPSEEEVSGKHR